MLFEDCFKNQAVVVYREGNLLAGWSVHQFDPD